MKIKFLFSLLLISLLSGCGEDVKQKLGIQRKSPDAFSVIANPPLSMPPDFELRPPLEEKSYSKSHIQAQEPSHAAKEVLLGTKGSSSKSAPSHGENALLQKAGISDADSNIKSVLAEDAKREQKKSPGLKKLFNKKEKAAAPVEYKSKREAYEQKAEDSLINKIKVGGPDNGRTPETNRGLYDKLSEKPEIQRAPNVNTDNIKDELKKK
jgi:hypothetical protein